jgi:hypothetical protein
MRRVAVRTRSVNSGQIRVRVTDVLRPIKPPPLTVTLPDLPTVPEQYRAKPYFVRSLLTDGDDNPKLAKSNQAGRQYRTWGLSLAPANASGYQVCSSRSPACAAGCLHYQGRARVFASIPAARIAKTIAYFEHRAWFESQLRWELDGIVRRGKQAGFTPAVRLNVLSDILWERQLPWVFEHYRGIVYYDYSKHFRRMLRWCRGDLPSNYHLTFSRSETNKAAALEVLRAGGNVAVVFRSDQLPSFWQGYPVINGDETDLRFLDPPNVVVGLYAKGTMRQDDSGFVVETDTSRISLPLA